MTLGPGIYYALDPEDYYADPVEGGSLSSTGARKLIPPSCPAKYRHWRDHPNPGSEAMDFGTVTHHLVLGQGDDYAVIEADSWRTKAAKEEAEEARQAGKTPILAHKFAEAEAMAEAVRTHPVASQLFAQGNAEVVLVWQDPATGVMLRAMVDWLVGRPTRTFIVDYKTTGSNAHKSEFGKSMANFGYDQQADMYLRGAKALGLPNPDFIFVVQEKEAPYLVSVLQVDHDTLVEGGLKNNRAIQTFDWCRRNDAWPTYHPEITTTEMPPWAFKETRERDLDR